MFVSLVPFLIDMRSVFKAISKSVKSTTTTTRSNVEDSTSVEETSTSSSNNSNNSKSSSHNQGNGRESNKNIHDKYINNNNNKKGKKKNQKNCKKQQEQYEAKQTRVDKDASPTTVTCAYIKAEYRILNILTHLKDMTQEYQYKEIPFDPLSSSPCDLQLNTSAASMSMHSISSQDNSSADASGAFEEMMEDDDDKKRREIEEEMYRYMCVLHEIVAVESVMEQYVLRELRHLQEFLCHKYPPIISYIRAPFDEIIECVRGKTKGLYIASPDPKSRPPIAQRLSAPSPMKIETSPCKVISAPITSPHRSTSSDDIDTTDNRGTSRERSVSHNASNASTNSSISSMPSKKPNKSNTVDELSLSSGIDSCEDDKFGYFDEI